MWSWQDENPWSTLDATFQEQVAIIQTSSNSIATVSDSCGLSLQRHASRSHLPRAFPWMGCCYTLVEQLEERHNIDDTSTHERLTCHRLQPADSNIVAKLSVGLS